MYIYIYIYTHNNMLIHMKTNVPVRELTTVELVEPRIHVNIHIHIIEHIYIYIHIDICLYIYIYIYKHMCVYIYIYTYIYQVCQYRARQQNDLLVILHGQMHLCPAGRKHYTYDVMINIITYLLLLYVHIHIRRVCVYIYIYIYIYS